MKSKWFYFTVEEQEALTKFTDLLTCVNGWEVRRAKNNDKTIILVHECKDKILRGPSIEVKIDANETCPECKKEIPLGLGFLKNIVHG